MCDICDISGNGFLEQKYCGNKNCLETKNKLEKIEKIKIKQ